jgi:hypothetical protein
MTNESEPENTKSDQRSKKVTKLVTALLLIGFAVLVAVSIPDVVSNLAGHTPPAESCTTNPVSASSTSFSQVGPSSKPVTATLESGQREEVDFGRSVTSRATTVYLDLSSAPGGSKYFHVRINQFLRSDDAVLRRADITATAERDETTLLLNVCFSRSGHRNSDLGDPGSYSGSVTIDDSRISSPVAVPLTVTMQYPNGLFLIWLYVAAIAPGAWCLWVIRAKRNGSGGALSWDFLEWAKSINGVVAIVAGGVSAFAVYTAVYLRDPTWGSSALEPLTLYGAMFSAFVTTSGLASLTGEK